jgi:4-diphosphocytidyl-2-C-methyl-D-erythritol kinase
MDKIELEAFAKINLSLNVLPERGERGYYKVQFVNTSVSLYDSVKLAKTKKAGILINEPTVDNSENIASRAARLMFDTFTLPGGLIIDITKHIPARAGLAGGSTDAAAVMKGIIALYDLSLPTHVRIKLAREVGMDVCYCIIGGLCRIEGIGDVVQPLHCQLPSFYVLIATPEEKKSSTAWAYSLLDKRELGRQRNKLDRLIDGIKKGDIRRIADNLHNDFEEPVFRYYPKIERIKAHMIKSGALNALLSGSGLSVFGIFLDKDTALRIKKELEQSGFTSHITQPVEGSNTR